MKKSVLLGILLILLIIPFIFAVENESDNSEESGATISIDDNSESAKINLAYECLNEKIKDRCSTSLEDNIFTLLAIGKCKKEVIDEKSSKDCWPSSGCNVKSTAQAMLAVYDSGSSVEDSKEWLLTQNITPSDVIWYLQIETSEESTCTISYSGASYSVLIGEDKKISSSAGSCLSPSEDGWWLRVAQNCYNKEFSISCNKGFSTSLLFKKKTSSTIYIMEEINPSSAEGTTTETVNSYCFAQGGVCNYEATLWATLALNKLSEETKSYLPYLMTMANENQEYIPEAFLHILTGDYRNDLLLKQTENYWDESGDKFYDTALALYPFQYEDPPEKAVSKNWLLEIQDKETGCWRTNTRNIAFILHSIWPRTTSGESGEDEIDCEDSGYYCMSDASCKDIDGEVLKGYECSGLNICCSKEKIIKSCANQNGKICNSEQRCDGGIISEASDLEYKQTCCIGGSCEEIKKNTTTECEENNGVCEIFECDKGYEETSNYDCEDSYICCIKSISQAKSYWWIWLLIILIVLVILGIIFKDKLRPFWFKLKSKFKKFGKGSHKRPGPRPGFPPASSRIPLRRPSSRRILHPSHQKFKPPFQPKPVQSKELDDVLKKLKEMSE